MKRSDITDLFPEATKEQIDRLLDINGADINHARGDVDVLRVQLTNANNEIERLKLQPAVPADKELQAQLKAATDELTSLKQANTLRDLREKVSKETGVPAALLTGETEDACKSQAEAIKAYSQAQPPAGYPKIPDGGEVRVPASGSARDKFAEWMNTNFPNKN